MSDFEKRLEYLEVKEQQEDKIAELKNKEKNLLWMIVKTIFSIIFSIVKGIVVFIFRLATGFSK
ncbi:MAG: hypothetical protein ACYDG2_05820 [Ruminiclostridium sp.]